MWSREPAEAEIAAARAVLQSLMPPPTGEAPRRRRSPLRLDLGPHPAPVVGEALGLRQGVWLDGGDAGRHLVPVRRCGELVGHDATTSLEIGGTQARLELNAIDAVGLLAAEWAARHGSDDVRLVGFLGYDLGSRLETMPEQRGGDSLVPEAWFALCDTWIERDRGEETVWSLCGSASAWTEASLAVERERLLASLRAAGAAPLPRAQRAPAPPLSRPDAAGYRAAVTRTVARIHAGDLFETNLCRRLELPWPHDGATLYRQLRHVHQAEYGAFLAASGWSVASASPEMFLRVRDGRVETRPIKGTRRRGDDEAADDALRDELGHSDKDAAELAMIVDLARNDLGRVCRPGSVRVQSHRATMTLPTVHHTYSVVTGELAAPGAVGRLLRATFPPASITGAPKIEAMRVAYAEEPVARGAAMGAIGWLSPGGDLELSVAIRTAMAADGRAVYHAGCGIVADSLAADELAESEAKARGFLLAVGHG